MVRAGQLTLFSREDWFSPGIRVNSPSSMVVASVAAHYLLLLRVQVIIL